MMRLKAAPLKRWSISPRIHGVSTRKAGIYSTNKTSTKLFGITNVHYLRNAGHAEKLCVSNITGKSEDYEMNLHTDNILMNKNSHCND
jgi:hypothetical protein